MIKGILFDIGSTLMYFDGKFEDADARGSAAVIAHLNAQKISVPSDFPARFLEQRKMGWKRAEETLIECTVADALAQTLEQLGVGARDGVVTRAVEIYFAQAENSWHAYPDAVATLQTLRARGYRVGAISNADDVGIVHRACARLEFAPYLDPIRSSAEEPRWRKPDPKIFQWAAKLWNLPPREIAYVGDAPRYDIVGAHRAGMRAILIDRGDNAAWQKIPDDKVNDPEWQADAVVEELTEVPTTVSSW